MYEDLPTIGTLTGFDFSKGGKGVVLVSTIDMASLLGEFSKLYDVELAQKLSSLAEELCTTAELKQLKFKSTMGAHEVSFNFLPKDLNKALQ